MSHRGPVLALVLAASLAGAPGCDDYPYDAAAAALGPETGEPGPRHRPGQPCLACHGPDYSPGELVFTLAGTIYDRAGDARGLARAEVFITDADGDELRVTTNAAGNFALVADPERSAPAEGEEGIWWVPAPVTFPLEVRIRASTGEQRMRNVIHREGSCAACHSAPRSATSAGKIFVRE